MNYKNLPRREDLFSWYLITLVIYLIDLYTARVSREVTAPRVRLTFDENNSDNEILGTHILTNSFDKMLTK